jgi:alpha-ribazole phosphatase/probable phosphoglycerate mutase
MNDLLFIRHAETNMAGTFCGHSDPPVNAAGRRQIQKLVEALRNEPIAAVYTSDLQRAAATARALAEFFSIPCIVRRALREIDFGRWEGLTWNEIEKLDLPYATRWLDEFPQLPAPGGESFEIFEARVRRETGYLLSLSEPGLTQTKSSLIAVVTHAGVMRAVLRTLCNVDGEEAWQGTESYCCIFRYAQQGNCFPEVLR